MSASTLISPSTATIRLRVTGIAGERRETWAAARARAATIVTNSSRGFAYAVIEIGVAYGSDLAATYEALRTVAQQLRADPAFAASIEDEIEIAGVERLDGAAVTVRSRLRVRPLEQWRVRREFLRRLRQELRARRIDLSQPPLVVSR